MNQFTYTKVRKDHTLYLDKNLTEYLRCRP
jgi:hypothetical protein